MKKILFLLAGALVFTNLFVSTGCEDDPVVDPVKDAPLVFVTGQPTTNLAPGATFTIEVDASKGTDDLASMEITEDGTRMDAARIEITGITLSNNPQSVPAADVASFVWNVKITAHSAVETHTYEVIVKDAGGLSDSESFNVTIEDPGTPISMTLTGVLFNQAGPSGKGTLDLDEGKGAGVTSTGDTTPDQTELRDMGLDCTIPAPGLNWRKQIGAFNGTVLRKVDLTQVDNFTFDAVTTVEEIQSAFDTGISYGAGAAINCANSASTAVQHVSEPLIAGDLLVVQKATKYYLIKVEEVNQTSADNNDNYKFSIKY